MDTWLLEFRLNVEKVKHEKEKFVIQMDKIVNDLGKGCRLLHKNFGTGITLFFADDETLTILLRVNNDGVCTVDVNSSDISNGTDEINSKIKTLSDAIRTFSYYQPPTTPEYPLFPKIMRGREFSHYDVGDNKIIERDFDRVVFDEVTPFQHIRILHSKQHGNTVYVDNDINIAESDYPVYGKALTGSGQIDYTGKSVLILGGGDGCVLRYTLDKNPKMVTVVDIDQRMIDAARLYLRGLCGDVLETMKCERYEIIVDDAANYLERLKAEGRNFDIILNEMNSIFVPSLSSGSDKDFHWKIMSLSMEVLKEGGKYVGHGHWVCCTKELKQFEESLDLLECSVTFKTDVVFMPSYVQYWVVYTISKQSQGKKDLNQ